MEFVSIDQNCHTLWDVLPKLDALAGHGYPTCHCIEDIDVAFTSIGAQVGADDMRVACERFYRSGGADWGAAVFYFRFLGRQPVDIRRFEPFTGMKTNVLAGKLGCSVDDLYDEFSPGDNWQLIGSSYFTTDGLHRVIGDLTVPQTAGFLHEIIDIARDDILDAFPAAESQQRIKHWIERERAVLTELIEASSGDENTLVSLYRRWLERYAPQLAWLDLTSGLFACGRDADQTALLEVFTANYDPAADLYNQAIAETHVPLRPLRTEEGELPFFATMRRDGHTVRSGVFLRSGGLQIADRRFELSSGGRIPISELTEAGITALAGKAMVLVIQARIGVNGRALAVPYRGSLYMPAAHRLAEKLADCGLLPGDLQPIMRVRLGFLDRLKSLETPIRLPKYLRDSFDSDVVPASELGRAYPELIRRARERLESFRTPEGRWRWQERTRRPALEEIDQLDRRRRGLAETDPKGPEIRRLSKRARQLSTGILRATVEQIARDWHAAELDYWDSRGGILPWAVALGGREFYNKLVRNAEIYPETSGSDPDRELRPPTDNP